MFKNEYLKIYSQNPRNADTVFSFFHFFLLFFLVFISVCIVTCGFV